MSVGFNAGESESQGTSQQQVWGAQSPFLRDLWSQSQRLMNETGPAYEASGAAQGLLNAANPAFESLLRGADPTQLNQDIEAMSADVTRSLTQNFLPALSMNAVATGGVGNPRASIAAGQAAGRAAEGVGAISANMRNQYAQRSLGALSLAPQLAGAQAQPLQNLWTPFMMQRGILGTPTVLGQSQSSSNAKNYGMSAGAV